MAWYELFLIRNGDLVDRLNHDFPEDLDALDMAQAFSRDYVVEVYEGIRLVARVKHGEEPLNMKGRG
jgi:hypothetical protein